ncbi:MAG TPA: hypothetical protein VIM70_14225 [Clostridium sp.]|uniref:hypothetical protein n=1 Tax=Clostridium sp. TaxID=1506 RepID=UPI002F94FDDB
MENEKFQEFMGDQFAKMFTEMQKVSGKVDGLSTKVDELSDSQVRMENKFDEQIAVLHDFRTTQEEVNKTVIERLDRIEVKVEVLQIETAHIRRVK